MAGGAKRAGPQPMGKGVVGRVAMATGLLLPFPSLPWGKASPAKMAPGRAGRAGRALGRRLQVDGGAVGAGGQDVGDVIPQEAGPVDAPVGQRPSPPNIPPNKYPPNK